MTPSPPSQFTLLRQRRFAPFFWTQFLGAFNDNVFKTALLTILTYETLTWTTLDPNLLNNLIPGLFILPFLLFSATAGQLADKFDKAYLARIVKLLEIGIMGVAAVGWMTHSLWLLVAAVAGMGMHSALFGPVKYSYLPQHLHTHELVGGNGVVEMGTFVGILLGEVVGAVLILSKPLGVEMVAGGTIIIAVAGWFSSRRIPSSPPPVPGLRISRNPIAEGMRNIRFSSRNRVVFIAMLGNSWFWFYGAILLAQFPMFSKNELGGDHSVFVVLLTVFSLGIGAGSLLCERLSGHKVEFGLVPFGAIGLTLFGIDLYLSGSAFAAAATGMPSLDASGFLVRPGAARVLADCLLIGVFGGLYIVPLFALIQTRSDRAHLSRTIAGMNILNALFMVVAAFAGTLLLKSGLTIPELFLVTALTNAVVTACIFISMPEYLIRFVAWVLIHTVYRVRLINAHRIPETGPALLSCNQVSHVDLLVITAVSPRPIRFVIGDRKSDSGIMCCALRGAKAIQIPAARDDHASRKRACDAIANALRNGELVCTFRRGKPAADDRNDVFSIDNQFIVDLELVPVIPITLQGLWGASLSRQRGNPFERSFRHGPISTLELSIGEPVGLKDRSSPGLPSMHLP